MPLTTLQAVNEILAAIGEPPVGALDTGGASDHGEAETYLDNTRERVLREGWACNMALDQEYEPDASGHIDFAASVLDVRVRPPYRHRNVSLRFVSGVPRLYDNDNATDQFTETFKFDVISLVDFDTLPSALQDYIVKRAALDFSRYKKSGEKDDAFARDEMQRAYIEAKRQDTLMRGVNVLDTTLAAETRGRRRGLPGWWGV